MTSTQRSNSSTGHAPESPSFLNPHLPWRRWGPYLSERQWGTVREDYSEHGEAWDFFSHDQARSRAYRWGEDGLLGICDEQGYLCFALALWNEADPILKERLFGLTGSEGNHGEDVKEEYFYLDSLPDHSYMRALYKYPHSEFPYGQLVSENQRRGKDDDEFELLDTGVFDESRYFDVEVEYAKAAPEDIVIRVTITNRGPESAPVHLLPTLWFRNTWAWDLDDRKPEIRPSSDKKNAIEARHWLLGEYALQLDGEPEVLFTENETNAQRLWGVENHTPYVKDGVNDAVVSGRGDAVSREGPGTKAAAHYQFRLASGESQVVTLRLRHGSSRGRPKAVESVIAERRQAADDFYAEIAGESLSEDERRIQRQAYAGLLWSKQLFYYDVDRWLDGDPAGPPPPESRKHGRNARWRHLNVADVISMPDKWEYPWFAAWDLAFHCVALAGVDAEFAKDQLLLLTRERYLHPNGQLPAYEWAFDDVNPPVQAWATIEVFETDWRRTGKPDHDFLERMFHRLLVNFTWWVNRKDSDDRNVFQGGFLGLDNIGVFDRSAPLPTGGYLEQSDATAWMGLFSLNMLEMAIKLSDHDHVYEDMAIKFFDHFMYIAGALNDIGGSGIDLWDEEDGFYYDVLMLPDDSMQQVKIQSLVGLIPLLAVTTLEPDIHHRVPEFHRRMRWFLHAKSDLAELVPSWEEPGGGSERLLALVHGHRMKALLQRMLDPDQFLSERGIRSISKRHESEPYEFNVDGAIYSVHYEPAESRSGLFGGNSNWRGPVWFPLNFLLIQALRRFHVYYGDDFVVECPVGSGEMRSLDSVADELALRLVSTFTRDPEEKRAVYGDRDLRQHDPDWRDLILFYEYFHGDTGAGLGASHQTGWTGLAATLVDQLKQSRSTDSEST